MGHFPRAGLFLLSSQPSPFLQTGPRLFLPRVYAKRSPVPHGPRVSVSLLRGHIPLRKPTHLHPLGRGNPSPFPCSSLHRLAMKFWPRPTPRCSIHATVGCPSHPLACWPLSSRIVPSLTEASRHPAAPTDHCQGCCAATMLAPSTQRQGLAQCLCFPLPCWHHMLASSRSPPSCLGARRHHALAHPCAPRGHDQHPPYPAHHAMPTYGQSPPPPRVPFTVPIATMPLRRASAHPPNRFATALSRHLPLWPRTAPCGVRL
jgi:hypothetical protein